MKKSGKILIILMLSVSVILSALALAACNEPTVYSITYILGGGTNHPDNPDTYTSESALITLKDPTHDSKFFLCWEEGKTIPSGSKGDKIFTAFWSDVEPTEGLSYTEVDGGYSVSAGSAINEETIAIPARYNGLPVKEIVSQGFTECRELTEIIIPDSVTSIGGYAFYDCNNLASASLPDSVISLGKSVFENCNNLTAVLIGNGVTSIEERAFYKCSGLESITLGNSITKIGDYAFYNANKLTSIILPDTTESIGDNAFVACSSLTNITIPESMLTIGKNAFFGLSNLTSITLPDGIEIIAESAFDACPNLTVYAEATSCPEGWDTNWNPSARPVVWNCTLSPDKTYVSSFTKTEDNIENFEANIICPPCRAGYTFVEWRTAATTVAAADIDTVSVGTVLFAVWTKN